MCDTRFLREARGETINYVVSDALFGGRDGAPGLNTPTVQRLLGHVHEEWFQPDVYEAMLELNDAMDKPGVEGSFIAPPLRSIEDFMGVGCVVIKTLIGGKNAEWVRMESVGCDEVTGDVCLVLDDLEQLLIDPRSPCLWSETEFDAIRNEHRGSGQPSPLRALARTSLRLCWLTEHPFIPDEAISSTNRVFGDVMGTLRPQISHSNKRRSRRRRLY